VNTVGRLVKHARYYWLPLAESNLTRRLLWEYGAADCGAARRKRVEGGSKVRMIVNRA